MLRAVLIQELKNLMRTHENIKNISTRQRDDYTTGLVLDYP